MSIVFDEKKHSAISSQRSSEKARDIGDKNERKTKILPQRHRDHRALKHVGFRVKIS